MTSPNPRRQPPSREPPPRREPPKLRELTGTDGEIIYTEDAPDIEPIVDGFLYPGLTLFCGRPKSGKSWLMLQAALGVAEGAPIAGRLKVCQPGQVLYIALEESKVRTTRRMHKLTPPTDFLRDITFIYRNEIEPAATGGILQIQQYLSVHPSVRLVVIDTLLAFQRIERKSTSDLLLSDYNMIQPIQELAAKYNCAIVIVDHSRKAAGNAIDVVSGSTGKTAAPDCVIVLKRQSDGSSLLEVLPRDADEQTYQMTLEKGTPFGWRIIAQGEAATMSVERKEVMDLLQEEKLTPKQLAAQTGRKEGAMRMLLKRMVEDGLVLRGEGEDGNKYRPA